MEEVIFRDSKIEITKYGDSGEKFLLILRNARLANDINRILRVYKGSIKNYEEPIFKISQKDISGLSIIPAIRKIEILLKNSINEQ